MEYSKDSYSMGQTTFWEIDRRLSPPLTQSKPRKGSNGRPKQGDYRMARARMDTSTLSFSLDTL